MSKAVTYRLLMSALVLFCADVFSCPQVMAQDKEALRPETFTLVQAMMCEQIRDDTPQNQAVVFPVGIGTVLCFSSFDPVFDKTFIYHYWFHRDRFSTRVKLSLKPPRWATFSSVQLREADKGPWRVEIRDRKGRIHGVLRFSIVD